MKLVCAGVIVARNDLWLRAALDDLRPPYLTADLVMRKLQGLAQFDWLECAVHSDFRCRSS
jgi:hypothetical protein